jgi:hypothetical protein
MKDSEKLIWEQMKSSAKSCGGTPISNGGVVLTQSKTSHKLLVLLILFVSVTYVLYSLKLVSTSRACKDSPFSTDNTLSSSSSSSLPIINATAITTTTTTTTTTAADKPELTEPPTKLRHVVFGIAASAKLWEQRKNYIKLWYRSKDMRGVVWLDSKVKTEKNESLPPVRISGDTSKFAYKNKQGHRSAIRISRIVSETLRLGMKDVRWFVMGDDDTVFVTENLVRILRKYDHNQFYYIGSLSESHLQNIFFSYGMAYGGGGFAISYPLAKALHKMQDRCIQRYPGLYGSDDRMHACMAELGVPLTKETGFHQVSWFLTRSLFVCLFVY